MEILLSLLMIILISLNAINIYYLYLILKIVADKGEKVDKESIKKRRKGNIAKVDFNNLMTGRKENNDPYEYLKNNRGLYEPVTGKKGIDLNTIKKEEV